jgi:xanthine dehydrogenase molybdopterin-binding subunit B
MNQASQAHFYMETQSTSVIPGENNRLEVNAATQAPTFLRNLLATVFQLSAADVSVNTKRVGGAFGTVTCYFLSSSSEAENKMNSFT